MDKKDFYEKLNKLKNICYNAEFDIMSTVEIDRILKENKDQILKIENDEKLLDSILEMFKKQNEEELKNIDTEKWVWYIGITFSIIFTAGSAKSYGQSNGEIIFSLILYIGKVYSYLLS